jgi:hypothetical protein
MRYSGSLHAGILTIVFWKVKKIKISEFNINNSNDNNNNDLVNVF